MQKRIPRNAACTICNGRVHLHLSFPYDGIFRRAVLNFKFHNCGAYAELLSHEMVRSIKDVYRNREFDLVTCVPMHKDTLRERGYNQAELLAKECARLLGIEYADLLAKTKKNKTQHSIKAVERAKCYRRLLAD